MSLASYRAAPPRDMFFCLIRFGVDSKTDDDVCQRFVSGCFSDAWIGIIHCPRQEMKPRCEWIDRAGSFLPMKQHDFRLSSPQWPPGPAGASGSKALVGGVPWASEVGGQDQFAGPLGTDGENADRDRSASGLPRVFEPAAGAASPLAAGEGSGFRERLAAFVRSSPAFSVSLSLHCLLLLLLTLWVVRERPLKKLKLSMAFGPASIQANDNGIDIVPAKEPTKQPDEEMTQVAKTVLPQVKRPQAVPTPKPELPDVAAGTAAAPDEKP